MSKKTPIFLSIAFSLFLLMGCGRQAEALPSDNQRGALASVAGNSPNSQFSAKGANVSVVPANLKEGMAYGDLRNMVISGKWSPKPHPNCKREVIGADFEKICSSSKDLCKQCDDLPELSECSGDGHCLMEFSDAKGQRVLTVATYGDIRDAKVEGEKSGLRVSWWNVE
ncbi:hypothetical protein [Xanthomonas sacchari]|uniref:hypothetical protein n=1 Tax=Xanthomonas sacchari TaxID=56458 RepID=UPI0012E020A4|nr:hypothetical protein [Xanthomonas sacchari]